MKIRLRALTVLFPNGFTATVHLPAYPEDVPEVDSAAEIVTSLEKYRNGLQRLIARSPSLSMGKGKVYMSVDEVIHTIVNARKYLDMDRVDLDYMQEHYYLDLINKTITFHNMSTGEERGSMPLKMFYGNWREMFYPEHTADTALPDPPTEISIGSLFLSTDSSGEAVTSSMGSIIAEMTSDEATTEEIIADIFDDTPVDWHMNSDKMQDKLGTNAYELWKSCMEHLSEARCSVDTVRVVIRYSGGGDSGQTDDVSVILKDKSAEHIIIPSLDVNLDTLIWNVIQEREGGFYNDDGGHGIMVITSSSFKWEHYNYITEIDQTINDHVDIAETKE